MASTTVHFPEEWAELEKKKAEFEEKRAAFERERDSSSQEYKLFAGNIDPSMKQEDITELFSTHGALKEVRIVVCVSLSRGE